MDNNEAREMDHADNATGPDHEQYQPFPFDRDHSHCMDRTGVNYVPCTSLTHCPSICDCPVGACTAAKLDTYAQWIDIPDTRSAIDLDNDHDHCTNCGYDLGTHHPTCLRAYGLGDLGNPNRPTAASYCYNCNNAPCVWTEYRADTVLDNKAGTCKTSPRPITLHEHNIEQRTAAVDALTDSQRRSIILLTIAQYPDVFQAALAQVTR